MYGSSKPQPDDPLYQTAYTLGKRLAEAQYAVMTGGYFGVMEGVSRGAFEAGGETIGITVSDWEARGMRSRPNPYLTETIPYPNLTERMLHLVTKCDAAIALDGGVGTISEVSLVWSFIQTGEVKPVPLILVGPWWADWLAVTLGTSAYVTPTTAEIVTHVQTVDQAVKALDELLAE